MKQFTAFVIEECGTSMAPRTEARIDAETITIIFGWRSKVVAGGTVVGHRRECRGETTHHSYGVFRYFHLYFIPTILYGKKVAVNQPVQARYATTDD